MSDLEKLRAIALSNVLNPNFEYNYRYVCRWYSKEFSTPLKDVYELPLQELMLNFFENMFENMEDDDVYVEAMKIIDPDYDENEEAAIQDFIKMVEDESQGKVKVKREDKPKPPTESSPVVKTFNIPEDEE